MALLLVLLTPVWGVVRERAIPFDDPAWVAVAARHCPADAILVMGAAQYNGTPSNALERRLQGALRLDRLGCAPVVVVSGGGRAGDRTTEGEAGVAWLARAGAAANLVAETRAANTRENLAFANALIPNVRWVVVTDHLHAARTRDAARWLDMQAVVVGVPTQGADVRYLMRELLAWWAYRLAPWP
jgi:uncharacterized SAM-binding protein YcdF (DUF218 family)